MTTGSGSYEQNPGGGFKDTWGSNFTTNSGQGPQNAGESVTITNPWGPNTPGTWNGSWVEPTKNG